MVFHLVVFIVLQYNNIKQANGNITLYPLLITHYQWVLGMRATHFIAFNFVILCLLLAQSFVSHLESLFVCHSIHDKHRTEDIPVYVCRTRDKTYYNNTHVE